MSRKTKNKQNSMSIEGEITTIKEEINDLHTKRTQKVNETKSWSFGKANKIERPLESKV